jgi:hypothetical protein
MNTLDLYIHMRERKLVTSAASTAAPKLPGFMQGDTYTVNLHFLEPLAGSRVLQEVRPPFEGIKLGVGYIDRAPTGGTWRVACGEEETAPLAWNISKNALATALNALGTVAAKGGVTVDEEGAANIFHVLWADTELAAGATLSVTDNRLTPKAFARVGRYETDQGWLQMLKIFQAPIAFVDAFSFPEPPAVTCAVARAGTGTRNAVVALTVPEGAMGSLDLVWGGLSTVILPVAALTSASIAAALNDLYTDGVPRFDVTNPRLGIYYIEYVGPLGLSERAAPEVTMHDQAAQMAAQGTLSLDVPGAELVLDGAAAVRDLVLECEMTVGGKSHTLFQQTITLLNDMLDPVMATAVDPVWLAETRASTAHVDWNPTAVVVGMLGYQDFAGDAVATDWTYTHNVGSLNVHITVRDTLTGLRVPDNLYEAAILNQNQVRVTFPEPPALDRYVVIISAANADTHYLAHTHAIADVTGLAAALAALSASGNPLDLWPMIPLDKLPGIPFSKLIGIIADGQIPATIPRLDGDGYLPMGLIPPEVPRIGADGSVIYGSRLDTVWKTLVGADGKLDPAMFGDLSKVPGFTDAVKAVLGGGGTGSALAMNFLLPSWAELYPGKASASLTGEVAAAALPKPGGLLPAIHTASADTLPVPLPTAGAAYAGQVLQNATGADVRLPSGQGRTASVVRAGEYVGCDGRMWYRVRQEGATTSWHPVDFERELLLLDVNEAMMPVGSVFTLVLDFETQILRAETRAQWVLLVEHGAFARQPDPAGTNIASIAWSATPLISCPLHLTPIRTPHTFGVQVTHGAEAISAATKLYRGAWAEAPSAPTSAGFALRARLARFDTEDSLPDPRGYVLLALNPTKKSLATII